jgi:hypothetical protein
MTRVSPETQAGLGSIAVLLFELLWWGGLVGVAVLLVISLRARRDELHPPAAAPEPTPVVAPAEQWPVRVAVALTAAGAVHLVMGPLHEQDGSAHVAFFLLTGAFQVVLAGLVLLTPSRHLHVVVWSGLGLIGLWALSRTVGVAGPRAAVGSWDLCVVLWQGYTVVEALRRLPAPLPTSWRPAVPRAWTLETYGVTALTGLALAVLPWSGGHG